MLRFTTLALITICLTAASHSRYADAAPATTSSQSAPDQLFSKEELHELLTFMEKAETHGVPLGVIQAVNRLQPLGKEKSLRVLEEYARSYEGSYEDLRRVFGGFGYYVTLVLFDVPKGSEFLPCPSLGFGLPKNPRTMPRFPISLVDDVPFLIAFPGFHSGPAPSLIDYLKWYHAHAQLRSETLHPTDKPMALLGKVTLQLNDLYGKDDSHATSRDFDRTEIANQVVGLIDTAYGFSPHGCGMAIIPGNEVDLQFNPLWEIVNETGIRWDVKRQCYIRGDGLVRIAEPGNKWRIQEWKPQTTGSPELIFSIERQRPIKVDVTVFSCESATNTTTLEIEFAPAKEPARILSVLHVPYAERPAEMPGKWGMITSGCDSGPARYYWSHIPLKTGEPLIINIKQGDKIVQTATFTP